MLERNSDYHAISGKPITNMRFADGIVLITDSMEKLSELTERLDKASAKW